MNGKINQAMIDQMLLRFLHPKIRHTINKKMAYYIMSVSRFCFQD